MSLLFTDAKIITTQNGLFKVLDNAFLGVEGKYIDYVGTERPAKQYVSEKNMHNRILMPGLVNSHAHSAMNLLKGLGSDLPLEDWLHTVWPVEDRMDAQDLTAGMEMVILEMLAGGTTSFSDMYMMPSVTQKCIGQSGIKADLTRVVMGGDRDTDYRSFTNRLEALDLYKNFNGAYEDRLHIDWSVHAEYTIDHNLAAKWAEEIQGIGGRLHIHLSETRQEHDQCIRKYRKTPAQWFDSLGFFNIPTYAAHCVWATEDDMQIFRDRGVTVVHNPTSNLKLGSGIAPVPDMLEKGINVALGTDGSASNNNVNMFEEMHLTSIIHNGARCNPTIMKPAQVLYMATRAGALAQGRADTGCLAPGFKADIVALNTDAPHMVPDCDTLALVTYSAQAADVCMTMVDGKILYENGNYLTMDRDRIFRDFERSCTKLS